MRNRHGHYGALVSAGGASLVRRSSLVLAASISTCVARPMRLRAMLFMIKALSLVTPASRARFLYSFARTRHRVAYNMDTPGPPITPTIDDRHKQLVCLRECITLPGCSSPRTPICPIRFEGFQLRSEERVRLVRAERR